jgi:hypothetical protein
MERLRRILQGMEKSDAARESEAYRNIAEELRDMERYCMDGEEQKS